MHIGPKDIGRIDYQIGQNIKEAREAAGLTQSQLGASVGCTPQQISKYELGQNAASAGFLHALAQVLERPVAAFYPPLKIPTPAEPFDNDPIRSASIIALAHPNLINRLSALDEPSQKSVSAQVDVLWNLTRFNRTAPAAQPMAAE